MIQVRIVFVLAMTSLVRGLLPEQAPQLSVRMSEQLSLVGRHTLGGNDDAVANFASWTRRDLEDVSNEWKRLVKAAHANSSGAWRPVALEPYGVISAETLDLLLERTAMLHTDVAIFRRNWNGYSLPLDPATEHPLSIDGRSLGVSTGTFHWEAARRLLDLVTTSAPANAGVLLWYQTTAAILQWWNDYYELEPHLARARGRFPRDAVLLMYDGTVHENLAEPRIQNVNAPQSGDRNGPPMPCLRLGCPPTSSSRPKKPGFATPALEWRTAQALFEQSLKLDPNLAEARIRLARVLALQDQHEAAITHLNQVLTGSASLPARLRYFSLLFLAREQWTLERREEAEIAYREAAALYPGAQSPQLGLSQLAHHRGDRERALAHLAILEAPAASDDRDDPWWTYNRVHVPDAIALMTLLVERLSK